MKKYFYASLIFIVLFSSCDNIPTAPDLASSYFPLVKGDKWYYKSYTNYKGIFEYVYPDQEYDNVYEIMGTTKINNMELFILKETSVVFNPGASDTIYYRTEGDKLYKYNKLYASDSLSGGLYVDFSKAKGDTFHCKLFINDFIGEINEKNETIIKIHYYIPGAADEDGEVTFLRNIGITDDYAVDWGRGMKLVKYDLR